MFSRSKTAPLKVFPSIFSVGATLLVIATSLRADSLKLTATSYSNSSHGGAYTAQILSGPASNADYAVPLSGKYAKNVLLANSFETFCLEPGESFTSGGTYDYTIAGYAYGGGNEKSGRNQTVGDQLSLGTTWLYSQYAQGLLGSAAYNPSTRKAQNLLLQKAFWYLEDDYSGSGKYTSALNAYNNNTYLQLVANHFGSGYTALANAQADALTGSFGVYALNLTSNHGRTQNQSQLYYDRPVSVPEATATVTLLGLGIIGIAGLRRNFGIPK